MSRLPILTAASAPEAARPALEAAQAANGYLPNLLGVLANAPAALEAYLTLSQINAKAGLTLPEREVVQLAAATRHGCTFCVAGHTALARNKARLPQEVIDALRAQSSLPDAHLYALAAFTREVIATRGRVGDDTLADFLAAGYTRANALEVILGVGLATVCNFANNLAHTPLNPQMEGDAWQRTE